MVVSVIGILIVICCYFFVNCVLFLDMCFVGFDCIGFEFVVFYLCWVFVLLYVWVRGYGVWVD